MQLGIVGLPNVGKSTLFNALTAGHASVSAYPFCTINPNVGIVEVPDERLDRLFHIYKPQKLTPAIIKFIDIAGLVKGASKGEGLGNQFLSHIREADGIIHIVRCFLKEGITHIDGSINPVRDIETIDIELMLADLGTIDRISSGLEKKAKSGGKQEKETLSKLTLIKESLEKGKPVRTLEVNTIYNPTDFLTAKPVLFVANTGDPNEYTEAEMKKQEEFVSQVAQYATKENAEVISISAQLETEIVQLPAEEREKFRQELGIDKSGLQKLIVAGYKLLDLVTFFTVVGNKEVRAWTVTNGTRAVDAAGKVHSDMKRGFIRAEVFNWDDLSKVESPEVLHHKGLVRTEGKDYKIKDGDIVQFRFNV